MTLSRTTEYALRALAFMARSPEEIHSNASLHRELRIPAKYLQRILTGFAKQGIIRSIRGRNGGYQLKRGSGDIFLSQVIDAVEGFQTQPACILGFDNCPLDNPCAMHDTWARTHLEMVTVLSKTRLSDLMPPPIR